MGINEKGGADGEGERRFVRRQGVEGNFGGFDRGRGGEGMDRKGVRDMTGLHSTPFEPSWLAHCKIVENKISTGSEARMCCFEACHEALTGC